MSIYQLQILVYADMVGLEICRRSHRKACLLQGLCLLAKPAANVADMLKNDTTLYKLIICQLTYAAAKQAAGPIAGEHTS